MPVLSQYQTTVVWAIFNHSEENFTSSYQPDSNTDLPSRPFILTILIAVCLSIIILLTILGNILVLIALCVDFALRSPTHLLMGNLACADLLLGITVLPFSATLEILDGQWLFGRTFCHIWLAIDVLYCTASIYGLMFISIERYIGVTRPLRYPIIITHRRTIVAILIAWLVSILVSIVPFLGWQNQVQSARQACLVNDNLSYVFFSCSFSFYIPLIIILCVYGRIYNAASRQYAFLVDGEKKVRLKQNVGDQSVTLRVHIPQHLSTLSPSSSNGHLPNAGLRKRSSTQMNSSGTNKLSKFRRERKAAKTLAIVVGMFILCWSPFFLLLPIKATTSFKSEGLFSICFWLGYCNSCFNPFIYAFSSREFRRAFESILKCHRTRHRPSASSHRISTTIISEQQRLEKSHSCDVTSSHSFGQSGSMTSYRASWDSQRPLDRPQLSVFRRISNPASSKLAISSKKQTSWRHRDQPNFVR